MSELINIFTRVVKRLCRKFAKILKKIIFPYGTINSKIRLGDIKVILDLKNVL